MTILTNHFRTTQMTTTMMMMVDCIRESGYIVVRITAPWSTYDMRADDQLTNVREANDDTHKNKSNVESLNASRWLIYAVPNAWSFHCFFAGPQ